MNNKEDLFYIKAREVDSPTNVRIIQVRPAVHHKLRDLSRQTHIPTYKLASNLIDWALDRIEIEDYVEDTED